jgi:pre-rRNA-processing protein TSR1
VTITLENVPPQAFSRVAPDAILSAVSLLPHENKVSVLHAGLSQTSKCEADGEVPVKSKDVLTFRCGWKTWQGRPIFSQNNLNSDKHKFERFMPVEGAFFACTMFGTVTYSPCPVLVFRESEEEVGGGKKRELLAHGSMIGADADRIVLKRIILTGYPTRVHKRHATVKYMFYNPEDVKVSTCHVYTINLIVAEHSSDITLLATQSGFNLLGFPQNMVCKVTLFKVLVIMV